eukprot:1573745-Rhodomonas_salina.3
MSNCPMPCTPVPCRVRNCHVHYSAMPGHRMPSTDAVARCATRWGSPVLTQGMMLVGRRCAVDVPHEPRTRGLRFDRGQPLPALTGVNLG